MQTLKAVTASLAISTVVLFAPSSEVVWSQPVKTIKLVVPFPPGGVADVTARLLAEQIGRAQGPAIVVENRPGAGTVIGTEAAARAAPDGNTVLQIGNNFVIAPNLKRLNYDPLTSFEPVCFLARSTFILP
jgi:tripartite-type tricarboxylate transporter receptor subunit TctC